MKKFRVEFKVSSNHLGEVLAAIHGQAEDLDVSLIEDVPHTRNKQHRHRQANGVGITDLLVEAMQRTGDHSITTEQGKKLLEQAGFKTESFYGAKYTLVKRGAAHFRNGKLTLVKQ